MSLRRGDRAGFIERLTDFFGHVRGGGLMLSPVDLALAREWEREGLPLRLVCRAIEASAEVHRCAHPGLPVPRHLAYYASAVDEAVRTAREKQLGQKE